jgi:hypothetical protein
MHRARKLVVVLLATLSLAVGSTSAASAAVAPSPDTESAALGDMQVMGGSFCTGLSGGAGSTLCMKVYGEGLKVNTVNLLQVSPGLNVCNSVGQVRYTLQGATIQQITTVKAVSTGCMPFANYKTSWRPSSKLTFKDGTSICGRIKNSATDGVYSNWACGTIRK